MTVSQDYTGRIVDLCVMETPPVGGSGAVSMSITGSGSVISGPWKSVQAFMKFLLTDIGSMPSDPAYGTEFISLLRGGQVHDALAFAMEFNASVPAILQYLSKWAPEGQPVDEAIQAVSLDSVTSTSDTVTCRISISFASGSTILVPVSIPVA